MRTYRMGRRSRCSGGGTRRIAGLLLLRSRMSVDLNAVLLIQQRRGFGLCHRIEFFLLFVGVEGKKNEGSSCRRSATMIPSLMNNATSEVSHVEGDSTMIICGRYPEFNHLQKGHQNSKSTSG